jgi:hypothetical protein
MAHTWSHVLSWCNYQGKHPGNSNSTSIREPSHERRLDRRTRDTVVGNTTSSLDKGVHILDNRTVITPATGLLGLMKPGG